MDESGVYQIRCLVNGKAYIGSSANIGIRWDAHRAALRAGNHHSKHLQRAWDKHGAENFVFEVIEPVQEIGDLLHREQYHMDHLQSFTASGGYNVSRIAGSPMTGRKHSPETLAKMSAAHSGRRFGPEMRAKVSKARKGKPLSEEHKQKLSEAKRRLIEGGYKPKGLSEEAVRKGIEARRGVPLSAEHRKKLSLAKLGKRRPPKKAINQGSFLFSDEGDI